MTDTKTVYIKRWRTLVNLPAKYADEIVDALRSSDLAQPAAKPDYDHGYADGVEWATVHGNPWQPIETAPRDGTKVWLFYPEAHPNDRQVMGWYDRDFTDGDRWMDHADCHDFIEPSHWRPLPAPPASVVPSTERVTK